ncbi:hypothetical protein [Nocardioides sp.]|uniref:hypothetical protein n=1 Tax=Nocardioides sp. TaxID=35761 RepID=UPI003782E0EA
MKLRQARLATAVIGTLAATALVAAPPAPAATLATSHVTATPSTTSPASSATFHVRGAVWSEGVRVPATIHIGTWRHGQWVPLTGAVMHTNRSDQYDLRVILQTKGLRQLRVTGDPDSAAIANARTTFTVTVR